MFNNGTYYQFNIDVDGNHFIRGIKITQSDGYFVIQEPTFHGINKIKSMNNKIHLSTNVVVCYFEIEKD